MYNQKLNFEILNQIKAQYDTIFQQNNSYRQSLLVSPYCSKFEKEGISPKSIKNYQNGLIQASANSNLFNYIKPFESQQLNKTQMKQKLRRKEYCQVQNRKKTEPDFEKHMNFKQQNEESIKELKKIIKYQQQRIQALQRCLTSNEFHKKPNKFYAKQIQGLEQQIMHKNQKLFQSNEARLQVMVQNYKKQLKFLVYNNQQLYNQLYKINEYCSKLQKTIQKALLYTEDLQLRLAQVTAQKDRFEQGNRELLNDRQQIMKNYEQQIRLFKKMRKVWQQQKTVDQQGLNHQLQQKNKQNQIQLKSNNKIAGQRSKSSRVLKCKIKDK